MALNEPIIFVGPPCSGVKLISHYLLYHNDVCWLDKHFERKPHSDLQHHLFKISNKWRHFQIDKKAKNKQVFHSHLSPSASSALNFWQEATRDDIDFYRGFALGKYASHVESTLVNETLSRRLSINKKSRLMLYFVGPSRLCLLKSFFPNAKFILINRDPASTVNSILNTEHWEYEGKNMLWWRGSYSLDELALFNTIRKDPVASTAFQLNKIVHCTQLEKASLDINALTIHYEDFIAQPEKVIADILDFSSLEDSERMRNAIKATPLSQSNKVLTMPATDVNTVYKWCPSHDGYF